MPSRKSSKPSLRAIRRERGFNNRLKKLSKKHPDITTSVSTALDHIALQGPTSAILLPRVAGQPVYKKRLRLGNKGKRGGARLIFYCSDETVVALFIYTKSVKESVPPKEISEALEKTGLLKNSDEV